MKLHNIKTTSGDFIAMTYNELCEKLGFYAPANFVKVTNAGTISFTYGKDREIRALLRACRENGFCAAQALIDAAKTR